METKKGTQLFSQGFSQTVGDGRKELRPLFLQDALNRRVFLGGSAGGLGYAALASLMQPESARAATASAPAASPVTSGKFPNFPA
jgi:hypothetical protein